MRIIRSEYEFEPKEGFKRMIIFSDLDPETEKYKFYVGISYATESFYVL